jgi:hypothetical protein
VFADNIPEPTATNRAALERACKVFQPMESAAKAGLQAANDVSEM